MMSNKLRWAVSAVSIVSLTALASTSSAVPAVTFDRDNSTTFMTVYPNSLAAFNTFTSSLSSYGVDGAETAAGFDPTLTFGATGITATAQGTVAQAAPGFVIGTQALLESDAAGFPQVDTTFTFNKFIKSFGLYVIQSGDGANANTLTFRLKNTLTNAFTDYAQPVGPGWGTDNAFFIGLTDTSYFNQVQILESNDVSDGTLYDNIVAGNAVPEPASFVLMMIGGVCAMGCRVRRS